jgi:hypothetical protein
MQLPGVIYGGGVRGGGDVNRCQCLRFLLIKRWQATVVLYSSDSGGRRGALYKEWKELRTERLTERV